MPVPEKSNVCGSFNEFTAVSFIANIFEYFLINKCNN